jgi:hypothetical protein
MIRVNIFLKIIFYNRKFFFLFLKSKYFRNNREKKYLIKKIYNSIFLFAPIFFFFKIRKTILSLIEFNLNILNLLF